MTTSGLGNSAFPPFATFSLSFAWSQLLFSLGPVPLGLVTRCRPRPSIMQVGLAPASSKPALPRHLSSRPRPGINASRPRFGLFQVSLAPVSCKSTSPRHLPSQPHPGIMQVGLTPASSRSVTDTSSRPRVSSSAPASSFLLGPGLELSSSSQPRVSSSAPASSFLLGSGLELSSSAMDTSSRPRASSLAPASSFPPRPRPPAFLLGPGLELLPQPRPRTASASDGLGLGLRSHPYTSAT